MSKREMICTKSVNLQQSILTCYQHLDSHTGCIVLLQLNIIYQKFYGTIQQDPPLRLSSSRIRKIFQTPISQLHLVILDVGLN